MKNIFLIQAIIAVLLSSCREETVDELHQDVEVAFEAVLQDSEISSVKADYDRGVAPVYVSGLKITATNNTYTVYDAVDSTFMFADQADVENPMTMIVKPGQNQFDATSIATNDAFTAVISSFDRADQTLSLEERVEAYADEFNIDDYPIFVEYSGSTTADIEFTEDLNTVVLEMDPQQGRVNVVFEGEQDLWYRLTSSLKDDAGSTIGTSSEIILQDYTSACGFVFNEAAMTGGSTVNVVIEKSPANDIWEYIDEVNISTQLGVNLTHLINFDGEETASTGFTVTFDPITDGTGITSITD